MLRKKLAHLKEALNENTITIIVLVVIVLVVSAFALLSVLNRQEVTPPTPAERFLGNNENATSSFTDLKGNTLDLDQHLGKIVIATAWASWCQKCKTELIKLATLSEQYADSDVVFLAVNRAEPRSTAESFLNTMPLAKPPRLILDNEDHFYRSIEGYTMPETVVYSKEGEVLYHARGPFDIDLIRSQLTEGEAE